MKEERIAIVYICIGEYTVFWKEFYESFEKRFLSEYKKQYFVFTDSDEINTQGNITVIYQQNLGWPGNTLFRYRLFLQHKEELLKYDYVFFMNANTVCVDLIGDEFLPREEGLVFVQHPGYYDKPPILFPYDRNRKSNAYIPYFKGDVYICGGINGGRSKQFLEMCETIDDKIEEDFKEGIIARWHDESHINKYFFNIREKKLLDPGFCYPGRNVIPFKPKILVKDKEDYLNIGRIKGSSSRENKPLLETLANYIYKCAHLISKKKKK